MVRLEADPSLYATPWFLTIFAANFPLGFVSRVLDLVFLEGTAAALVKVAVCLLQEAGPLILAAHNLEELMLVMKEGLPSLPHSRLEDVISQAGSLNISRSVAIIFHTDQESKTSILFTDNWRLTRWSSLCFRRSRAALSPRSRGCAVTWRPGRLSSERPGLR